MTPPPRAGAARDDERRARDASSVAKTETETSKPKKSVAPLPGASKYAIHADASASSWMPRLAAFAPGGPLATRFLAHQPVVCAVGSTVFAHGGVLRSHARVGLRRANRETAEWLAGSLAASGAPPAHVTGADSVVWARTYSHPDAFGATATLDAALSAPGMARVVVGHTIGGRRASQRGVRGESDPRGRGHVARVRRARAGGAGDPGRRRGGDLEAALGRGQEKGGAGAGRGGDVSRR